MRAGERGWERIFTGSHKAHGSHQVSWAVQRLLQGGVSVLLEWPSGRWSPHLPLPLCSFKSLLLPPTPLPETGSLPRVSSNQQMAGLASEAAVLSEMPCPGQPGEDEAKTVPTGAVATSEASLPPATWPDPAALPGHSYEIKNKKVLVCHSASWAAAPAGRTHTHTGDIVAGGEH